ncbi:MAG: sigma-70 family RNA polymerase sigma factor [Bacteroidota bacterium]
MPAPHDDADRLLARLRAGDDAAMEALLPLIYDELKAIARRRRVSERPDHTLNTTALVHEAFIKLVDGTRGWNDRLHFMAIAARAMRQILIDYGRARATQKRGGDWVRVPVTLAQALPNQPEADDTEALERALQQLERLSPRQARVVECRYFAGLTIAETAAALDLSEPTVKRDWRAARLWLYRQLQPTEPTAQP